MGKKEKTLLVITTLALILIVGTLTYAFFSAGISNENKHEVSITTGDMKLTFEDGSPTFSAAELTPGASVTKTFTIENTGSKVTDMSSMFEWARIYDDFDLSHFNFSNLKNAYRIFGAMDAVNLNLISWDFKDDINWSNIFL